MALDGVSERYSSQTAIVPDSHLNQESEFVIPQDTLLNLESLAYAHKQRSVGLLTFAVIQTYLSDTCL